MKLKIRKTLAEHQARSWRQFFSQDHYKFSDGSWLKHWWAGLIWITLSNLK